MRSALLISTIIQENDFLYVQKLRLFGYDSLFHRTFCVFPALFSALSACFSFFLLRISLITFDIAHDLIDDHTDARDHECHEGKKDLFGIEIQYRKAL